jgi:dTMP kinase
MVRGRFITIEGIEGAGKSTQVRRLVLALEAAGVTVTATREPGGSTGAEAIRRLILDGADGAWTPVGEVLLHYAARCEHAERLIRPALAAGSWVVSDRFADSTMAYQGFGLGVDRQVVQRIHDIVIGDLMPDATVILDVPVADGLSRARRRTAGADRYESMNVDFHERVRQGFLAIAREAPRRCVVVAGDADEEAIHRAVCRALTQRLGNVL